MLKHAMKEFIGNLKEETNLACEVHIKNFAGAASQL